MFLLSAVVLLGLAASGAHAQVPFFGSCPSQAAVKPFDVTQYLGKWYEQEKYFAIFQAGGKCVSAVYTDQGNGLVGVNNAQVNSLTGSDKTIQGTAKLAGDPNEGKLVVTFPSAGNMPAPYWVLATDYTSYAVVWSCTNIFGIFNTQFLWVLTREKNPSAQSILRIEEIIRSKNLSTGALKKTQQNCA